MLEKQAHADAFFALREQARLRKLGREGKGGPELPRSRQRRPFGNPRGPDHRAPGRRHVPDDTMAHAFDEIVPASVIRINENMEVLDGPGTPNPAVRFHFWVYRQRPDVQCIIHTHPPHVSTLSMTGQPLVVAHMDATPFHNDCAHLKEWPGLPIADRRRDHLRGAGRQAQHPAGEPRFPGGRLLHRGSALPFRADRARGPQPASGAAAYGR